MVAAFLSQNGAHVPPKSKSKLWVNGKHWKSGNKAKKTGACVGNKDLLRMYACAPDDPGQTTIFKLEYGFGFF